MHSTNKKLNSIQSLRGLAAMLVVMFHFRTDLATDFPVANWLFAQGAIGVDLFFMISGFIVYYVTLNENNGVKSSKIFLIKRICRIFPPYFIATLFIAGNSWDKWSSTLRSFSFLPADITQAAPYFGYPRLFVGWSLNYEFVFYTICGFALLFRKHKYTVLTVFIVSFVALPCLVNDYGIPLSNINYGYHGYLALITNGMMLEFVAGIFIGYIAINMRLYPSKYAGWAVICLPTTYFIYITLGFGNAPGNGNYDFAAASFFLLLSLSCYEYQYGINPPKFLTSIGTISFSIYLMHPHGLSLARKLISRHYHGSFTGVTTTLMALIFTALFSMAFYKLFEVGLSNHLRRKLLNKLHKPVIAVS
ncbi:acyltransferase family protein [Pantoea agglomerans]|uniref:acyltransferase family protein n=1 Tax=Enterobacter agglomerans TaxID=549 RepID=UPI001F2E8322|nr:acyltransferase [Pantoea agglomerans]UJL38446.1 acyltransferase [Pantoea agglomerans]